MSGTPADFDADAYAEAAAPTAGFVFDAASRAAVAANLRRTAAFAAVLLDDPDVAAAEPAVVFAPEPVPPT